MMERIRDRTLAAALCVALLAGAGCTHAPPTDTGPLVEILAPVPGSVVRTSEVLVVCRTLPGVRLQLVVDGVALEDRDMVVPGDDTDLHHIRVPLAEGRHQIEFTDAGARMRLDRLTVTYIPAHSLRMARAKGDVPYRFHTREQEGWCRDCHNLPDPVETHPSQPLSPAGKVCGACHPDIERGASVHGPVAVFACFECHRTEYAPSRFLWMSPEGGSCESCHTTFLSKLLGTKKYVHGPVAVGVCTACHDPHRGTGQAVLRGSLPELCLRCHGDTIPAATPAAPHGGESCLACHDPHGSATEFLVVEQGPVLCGRCHTGVADMQAKGHPIPEHPVEADSDPSRPGRPMSCISCHDIHGSGDRGMLEAFPDEEARSVLCRRCHY